MTVRVWKRIALTAALLVWGAASQAQTTGGATGGAAVGVAGGQGAVPQVRPAPVTGRVATDPAAVALRPAGQQPLTSSAKQVPPPANPNEPLLAPESEQVTAPSATHPAQRGQQGHATPATAPEATPSRQHEDRTHGVKKSNETQPRPHERKTKGKPHHAGQKASSVEPKDERHKGGKRGAQLQGKQGGVTAGQHVHQGAATSKRRVKTSVSRMDAQSTEGRVAHHHKPIAGHAKQAGTQQASQARRSAHLKQASSAGKTRHAHAAAKASAPVAKKPVRHKHPTA